VAGRTITVTELDGRRVARLRVTANVPAPPQPATPPAANAVPAGQVRLDSDAPQE